MKGNELRDSQLPPVTPLDPETERRAALNVAYRLQRRPDDTSAEDVLTVLRMCGLAPYAAADAKVDTNGMTVYPESQRRRRAANRLSKQRARDRKRNEEAS